MELLRNQVSRWSYCAIGSAGGAIAQWVELLHNRVGGWVELLHNRVSGWNYCATVSVGGVISIIEHL